MQVGCECPSTEREEQLPGFFSSRLCLPSVLLTAMLPNSRTLDGYPPSVKTGQQLYIIKKEGIHPGPGHWIVTGKVLINHKS